MALDNNVVSVDHTKPAIDNADIPNRELTDKPMADVDVNLVGFLE